MSAPATPAGPGDLVTADQLEAVMTHLAEVEAFFAADAAGDGFDQVARGDVQDRPGRVAGCDPVEFTTAPGDDDQGDPGGFQAVDGRPYPLHCWRAVATRPGDLREEYALAALEAEAVAVERQIQPGRKNAVNRAGFNLGMLIAAGAIDRATVEHRLRLAGKATGLSTREINRNINSGIEAGLLRPRVIPPVEVPTVRIGPGVILPPGVSVLAALMREEESGDPDDPTVGAETIAPTVVRWVWDGRIPRGS